MSVGLDESLATHVKRVFFMTKKESRKQIYDWLAEKGIDMNPAEENFIIFRKMLIAYERLATTGLRDAYHLMEARLQKINKGEIEAKPKKQNQPKVQPKKIEEDNRVRTWFPKDKK